MAGMVSPSAMLLDSKVVCAGEVPVGASAEKKGIAARMRELPPGSGIPNLLSK